MRFLYFLLPILLAGCSTLSGYSKSLTGQAPVPKLGIIAKCEDIRVEVLYVIQPGDPNSWVDNARWTEVIIQVSNLCSSNLTTQKANLIDQRGVLLSQLSNVLAEFDQKQLQAKMQETQLGYGLAQQGVGQAMGSAYPYAGAGVVGSIVQGGLSLAQQYHLMSIQNELQRVQEEAQKRALVDGTTLTPTGTIQGSLFFPHTPAPQKLVYSYLVNRESKTIEIPLTKSGTSAEEASLAEAKVTSPQPKNPYVEVVVNQANVRSQPKTGKIIKTVAKGTRLEKLDEANNWTKVLIGEEAVGWIASELVKQVAPEVITPAEIKAPLSSAPSKSGGVPIQITPQPKNPTVVVITPQATVRSYSQTSGTIITVVSQGTQLEKLGDDVGGFHTTVRLPDGSVGLIPTMAVKQVGP